MCGIAGCLNLDGAPVAPLLIHRMTDALAHRGPDGEGHFLDGPLALGHRRLAILDLTAAGHQPMQTADGRFVISYNGEVYNFRELRRELEGYGHVFHSHTDTEVVLHAYVCWGAKAVERLNGMFAIAVWDRVEKRLFLARDRYGIKPLYWARVGETFLFASEIKAILQHPDAKVELNREGLLEYFTFQNFFADRTLFQGIQIFPSAHWLTVPAGPTGTTGVWFAPTRYWDYCFQEPENPGAEIEYLEELDRLFQQAVARQLVSDVPVGAYLSGGMDSGAITAVAARQLSYMHTFTCGFDLTSASGLELGFDERQKAEFMSARFRTEHYEMVLKAGDMERAMPKLLWHLEEPRVGQSYPNYYAAKLASKFVKVVLAGTGGDEMFGGYPWRYYRAVVNDGFEHYVDKYFRFWQRLLSSQAVHQVFAPIWSDVKHIHPRDIFSGVFAVRPRRFSRPEDYVNHSLYFESKTFLHGLLVVEDKLGMAHGLETRVPFLDNDLVDFAMRLPVSLKLGNLGRVVGLNENEPGPKTAKYFDRARDGKLLLRKMMARYVPAEIADGVKQGFSAPDASWFKGDSIEYVRRSICNPNARIYSYFDHPAVLELVNDHLDGRVNRRLLIWSLLNFEQWLTDFLPNHA